MRFPIRARGVVECAVSAEHHPISLAPEKGRRLGVRGVVDPIAEPPGDVGVQVLQRVGAAGAHREQRAGLLFFVAIRNSRRNSAGSQSAPCGHDLAMPAGTRPYQRSGRYRITRRAGHSARNPHIPLPGRRCRRRSGGGVRRVGECGVSGDRIEKMLDCIESARDPDPGPHPPAGLIFQCTLCAPPPVRAGEALGKCCGAGTGVEPLVGIGVAGQWHLDAGRR